MAASWDVRIVLREETINSLNNFILIRNFSCPPSNCRQHGSICYQKKVYIVYVRFQILHWTQELPYAGIKLRHAPSSRVVIFLYPLYLALMVALNLSKLIIKSVGRRHTLTVVFIYIPETLLHVPGVWPTCQNSRLSNFQLLLLAIRFAVIKI